MFKRATVFILVVTGLLSVVAIAGASGFDRPVHIRGEIASFSDSEIVIDESTVSLSAETRIEGELLVGAKAHVIAIKQSDDSLVAKLVAVRTDDDDDDHENKFEVEGEITALSDESITIGEKTIVISAETIIRGDLVVGAEAEAKVIEQEDGSYLAIYISLEDDDDDNKFEVEGEITALTDESITIGEKTLVISAETIIRGDLAIGAEAEAKVVEKDGSYFAVYISIENDDDDDEDDKDHLYVIGTVSAISDDSITAGGTNFVISDTTEIRGELTISETVGVKGYTLADGTNIAKQIRVIKKADHHHHKVLAGIVSTFTSTTLTVNGKTVEISAETTVHGELTVGNFVIAKVSRADDGTLTAEYIRVIAAPSHQNKHVKARGEVEAVSDSSITVGGIAFVITDTTRIKARSEITVGVTAAVRGYTSTEGIVIAKWIKLFDGVEAYGQVESLSGDEIVVSGVALKISGETFVDGDFSIGDTVQYVAGEPSARGVTAVSAEYIGSTNLIPTAVSVSASSATTAPSTNMIVTLLLTLALAALTLKVVRKA